jgi:short-subunit dehydrogenase
VRGQLHDDHGPIDVLVNNAGIVHGGRFLEVTLDRHLKTYEINTHGVVIVTHAFLPDLIAQKEGHLVIIGSAAGMLPLSYASTYASSKSAVYGFAESIREELRVTGHKHVGVTAVCPSYLSTGLFNGVKPPKFTSMLTPERLSGIVLKSVRGNRELVLAPWIVNLIPLGNALLPRAISRWLLDWLGVTVGMSSWNGHTGRAQEEPIHGGTETLFVS